MRAVPNAVSNIVLLSAVLSAALAALPRAARADGALEELSAGGTEQTPSSPATRWLSDKIAGIFEPTEHWQLRLDAIGTRAYQMTKAAAATTPTDILLATLAVEYDPDPSWSFRVVGGYSPSATTTTATTVQVAGARDAADANAQLASTSGSRSAAAWVGYDTSGGGDFETSVLATATLNDYDLLQQLASVTDKAGAMLGTQQIRDTCATRTCSPQLVAALAAQPGKLRQLVVEGSLGETLWRDTDVAVGAAYYAYDRDPMQLGFASVGTVGRTANASDGAPIAPLQYTVMPSLVHRWGGLMALASVTYGRYVDGEGYNLATGLRLQYRLKLDAGRRLKLWSKLGGSRDVVQQAAVRSGQLALGLQYSW